MLALVCLGLALAQDAFFHTDDGCGVETHCVACLWHYGAIVVTPAVAQVSPPPVAAQLVAPRASHRPTDRTPGTAASRGPPLA